jgi:RNA polymerase sigma-70 factor (ECF subfamily)
MATKDRELRYESDVCGQDSMRSAAANLSSPMQESEPRMVVEARLLERLRRGDRDAATEFYDVYAARIHRFILHALGSSATIQDADDLMQETFMAVAEGLPFFRGESTLFTFACAIAHRKTMSFLRTRTRRAQIAATIDPPPEAGEESSGDETVRRAFGTLKPEYRELLHLKYVEEETTAQIARIVRATEHAVESKLKRAREALRKLLEKER